MKSSLIVKYGKDDRGKDILSSFLKTIPENKETYEKNKISYHQGDVSNISCVFHSALTVLSNLWCVKVSIKRRVRLIEGAKRAGVLSVKGAKLYKGVDFVRRRWNLAYPDKKTNTLRLPTIGEGSKILFDLGYMSQTGRRLYNEYSNDLRDDGILNSVEVPPDNTGWHATTLHKRHGEFYVVNSYNKWTSQPNVYKVDKLSEKVKNSIFLKQSYFWLPKFMLEERFTSFKR